MPAYTQIPGFVFLHKSRQNKKCGGVAIYVREQLNFKTRPDLYLLKVNLSRCLSRLLLSTIVGKIYRVLGTSDHLSVRRISSIVEQLNSSSANVIIGCDQNFDFLRVNEHAHTAEILNLFISSRLATTIN